MSPLNKLTGFANAVLLTASSTCVLTFLYFFYWYSWTHRWQFSSVVGPFSHYVLPILFAAGFSAGLLLPPVRRINLALLVLSVGISLYSANLVLRIDLEFRSRNFDVRGPTEITAELKKKGILAVLPLIPKQWMQPQPDGSLKSPISIDRSEVLPLGGVSNATTVYCNESGGRGKYVIYESDEHGFNNPPGTWSVQPIDIVALGDSFTQGACVPSDKNFVGIIRSRFRGTLNLGMSGNGPLVELAALREYVTSVKPAITLWCYYEENDLADLLKEQKSELLRKYLDERFTQHLLYRQTDIDRVLLGFSNATIEAFAARTFPARAFHSVIDSFKLAALREVFGLLPDRFDYPTKGEEYSDEQMALFRDILLHAKAATESWQSRLYFVYLPARDGVPRDGYHSNAVLDLVTSLGLPVIDVRNALRTHKDASDFYQVLPPNVNPFGGRRFGHFNETGHRVVAEQVLKSISLEHMTFHGTHQVAFTK